MPPLPQITKTFSLFSHNLFESIGCSNISSDKTTENDATCPSEDDIEILEEHINVVPKQKQIATIKICQTKKSNCASNQKIAKSKIILKPTEK